MSEKIYVLTAMSSGDDLFPPSKSLIAVSFDKTRLEELSRRRTQERNEWLQNNYVPDYEAGAVISSEKVEEVQYLESQ